MELERKTIYRARNGQEVGPVYDDMGFFSVGFDKPQTPHSGRAWRADGSCATDPNGEWDLVEFARVYQEPKPSKKQEEAEKQATAHIIKAF